MAKEKLGLFSWPRSQDLQIQSTEVKAGHVAPHAPQPFVDTWRPSYLP